MTLLMLNFGTFRETNIFAHELLNQGFALYDSTNGSRPAGLSLRVVEGDTKVFSLYSLGAKQWTEQSAGLAYPERFRRWIQGVVDTEPEVVYLTGHHAPVEIGGFMLANDWPEDKIRFAGQFLANGKGMVFGPMTGPLAAVDLAPCTRACRLVVGFGCNVAKSSAAQFYQRVFCAGARRSIVLGWSRTMTIPTRGQGSVNREFFRRLAAIPGVEGHSIGDVCERWPAEVIAAWGNAVATYQGGSPVQSDLLSAAAARDANGVQYTFALKAGVVRPVPS
jgi:hypothetical protein